MVGTVDPGPRGVWYAADKLEPGQWKDFIAHVEKLGYGTLWHSESRHFEGYQSPTPYVVTESPNVRRSSPWVITPTFSDS